MARFSISPIKVGNLSFLILDCPSDATLPAYIPIFEEHNVTDLVRICEGNPYKIQPLKDIGIEVHDDMKFDDGTAPSKPIVARWLELNDEVFFESPTPDRCIAVHCVSGIGRAPVLVAISLVEGGMDALDAIAYIRKARRGALNRVQIAFLDSYKKRKKGFGAVKKDSKSKSKSASTSTAAAPAAVPGTSSSSSTGNGTISKPTSTLAPPQTSSRPQSTNSGSSSSNDHHQSGEDGKKKSGFMSKLFGKK